MTGDEATSAGVRVARVPVHSDDRGHAFEPLGPAELPGQRNVHVVLTGPGHVRGNHVHRRGTEVLVVRGPALVRYRERDEERDVEVEPGDVVSFTIPPGVPHAILNTGSETSVLVGFRDIEHDPDDPDTERVVLI